MLAALTFSAGLRADEPVLTPSDASTHTEKSGGFVFSILPKAFQSKPTLDMTFNTEMTAYGRLLRPASPENPTYYIAQDAGFHPMGETVGGEKPPPQTDMERTLIKALANNGYLPAAPGHPPTLAIIYFWGSHNKLDPQTARQFPLRARQYALERATLVGGKSFAQQIDYSMQWGDSPADHFGKAEILRDQTKEELYYVVASAYDYQSLANKERKLAWRTTMTVTSAGLAMRETLPPLVASAAMYFGRETTEPEVGEKTISRGGHVEIGPTRVVPDAPAPPSVEKKPDEK